MAELEIRTAWKREDAELEQEAISFWENVVRLPTGTDPKKRAKELLTCAFADNVLVGLSTAEVMKIDQVRHNFAFHRIAIAREFRRQELMRRLVRANFSILAAWSVANPEAKLAGLATVFEAAEINAVKRPAVTEAPGLALVGFNQNGQQVRIRWFDHTLV